MTQYDLLKINRSLLLAMEANGINMKDVLMVPMVEEAEQMEKQGEKKKYIIEKLSEKYKISARSVYYIIDRLHRPIII